MIISWSKIFKSWLKSFSQRCLSSQTLILCRLSWRISLSPLQWDAQMSIYLLVDSEQTYQILPLLDLLLNFIAGGGNLSLCRQNSTKEAHQCSSYGHVERPAERAQSRPEGWRLGPAVANYLLWTPTSRVQHEAHHQQQAWRKSTQWDERLESHTCKHLSWEHKQIAVKLGTGWLIPAKNKSIWQALDLWLEETAHRTASTVTQKDRTLPRERCPFKHTCG